MSELKFMHQNKVSTVVDGKRVTNEEGIYEGSKGLTIKFYHNEDGRSEKITIVKRDDNTYTFRTEKEGTKKESDLTYDQLLEALSKDPRLSFATEFLKTQTTSLAGQRKGGRRTMSRKRTSSRKSTKRRTSVTRPARKRTRTRSRSTKRWA